jgi:hypothetical protein
MYEICGEMLPKLQDILLTNRVQIITIAFTFC